MDEKIEDLGGASAERERCLDCVADVEQLALNAIPMRTDEALRYLRLVAHRIREGK